MDPAARRASRCSWPIEMLTSAPECPSPYFARLSFEAHHSLELACAFANSLPPWSPLEVWDALDQLRQERPGVGEAYIFPAPESKGHVRVDVAGKWLREAKELAEDHEHVEGFGWHAFRRMWATKRKHLS